MKLLKDELLKVCFGGADPDILNAHIAVDPPVPGESGAEADKAYTQAVSAKAAFVTKP